MTSPQIPVAQLHEFRNDNPIIVLFFYEECGHCKILKPKWNDFKAKSPIAHSEISLPEMNNYQQLPTENPVRGYPTIRLYNKGKLVKEYDGDRSSKDILKFVKKYAKTKKSTNLSNLVLLKAQKKENINKRLLNSLAKAKAKAKSPKKKTKPSTRKRKRPTKGRRVGKRGIRAGTRKRVGRR